MAVKPVPEGYRTVTPCLTVTGVAKLLDFLQAAFGAEEIVRMPAPDGKVMHAEVKIGDSMIMLGEAGGEHKPMPATIYLYVPDADATYKKAVAAGGQSIMPMMTQFYGDRSGGVKDASGNVWYVATHVEDVPPDEMDRRAKEYMKEKAKG